MSSTPSSSFRIGLSLLTFHSRQKPNLGAPSSILNSSSSFRLIASFLRFASTTRMLSPTHPIDSMDNTTSLPPPNPRTKPNRNNSVTLLSLHTNFCNYILRPLGLIRFSTSFPSRSLRPSIHLDYPKFIAFLPIFQFPILSLLKIHRLRVDETRREKSSINFVPGVEQRIAFETSSIPYSRSFVSSHRRKGRKNTFVSRFFREA